MSGTAQKITITPDAGATSTYYTTDGSAPTTGSTLYSAPFDILLAETVKAISVAAGIVTSAVGSEAFAQLSTPVATPTGGSYTGAQSVTLAVDGNATATYYTTNGGAPTVATGTLYTGAITVPTGTTAIKAFSVASGYVASAKSSDTYVNAALPALLASVSAHSDSSPVTSGAIDTTGATLLVVVMGAYYSEPTIADSKSNTWQYLTPQDGTAGKNLIAYCYNPNVGTGHTFTITASSGYCAAYVAAFSHMDVTSSVFEHQNGHINGAAGTTVQAGSVTPNEAAALVIMGETWYSNTPDTIGVNEGFSLLTSPMTTGHQVATLAYLVTGSAANPTITWGTGPHNSYGDAAVIACFKSGA